MATNTVSGTSDASQSSNRAQNRQPPTQETSGPSSAGTASKPSSASNSVNQTPFASRDSSPIRPPPRSSTSKTSLPGGRSRKNSQHDTSPSRTSRSQIPQSQGVSRTLSASTIPSLPPAAQEASIKAPVPQKAASSDPTKENGPRWPISPRLRSPPPNLNKSASTSRRLDQDPPVISLQRATPSPQPIEPSQMSESETEEIQLQSGIRTPARSSTLETVQEVSLPNSPKLSTDAAMEQVTEKLASELANRGDGSLLSETRTLRARPAVSAAESGSESGSVKTDGRRTAGGGPPPPLMTRQSSALSTKPGKGKASGEGSTQNMTVETETVAAVPAVAVAPTGNQGGNGTLKAKPSTETIKPKKEKKKATRKQPAVSSGNASSKAEIFEAKVASAVDENDDSDSEETFVYDSNPPEGPRRFHSRTPSATSMMSQAERSAMRSIHSVIENSGPPVAIKKHTKFASATGGESTAGEEDGRGTGRSNAASSRGTTRHHHHVGRWPRNGHASLFDSDSPFPMAQRSKLSAANSKHSSGPPSPRNGNGSSRNNTNGKRPQMAMANSYDLDDTTGADDERTPLISAGSRSSRVSRSRRTPMSQRQLESQSFRGRPSYLNRFAACLVVTMMLLVVITGAIGFMFATSQPLTDIELTAIHNVIASEPELMFDVTVRAHNPNIVVVTIDDANLEVFAKSIHAGSDSEWWRYPHGPPDDAGDAGGDGGDVHITDDPDFPDDDAAPNMRLGTITELDSPLSFEGSFFHKGMSSSTGEMRLQLPGNQTAGGSERWGRILQDEFDLIIKGIVKYNLPLSQKVRSAAISGRTTVKPNSANDPSLRPNTTESVMHKR